MDLSDTRQFTSLPTSSAVLTLGRHCRRFAHWTPVLLPKPLANAAHMVPVLARQPPNFFALHVLFLENRHRCCRFQSNISAPVSLVMNMKGLKKS